MADAFNYGRMAATADRLLTRFAQGLVTVERVTAAGTRPPELPIWQPWEPEVTVRQYRLEAVVRTVERKFVDGALILVTDDQVTCSDKMTLVSVNGAPVAEEVVPFDATLLDTLKIDGRPYLVLKQAPTPGAGTTIVHNLIVRGGMMAASPPAPPPPPPPPETIEELIAKTLGADITFAAGSRVGIQASGGNIKHIWRQIAGHWYSRERYDDDGVNRLSWRATEFIPVHRIYRSVDCNTSGTWSTVNTATANPGPLSHVASMGRQTTQNGAWIETEVSADGPYDVVVCFAGRTTGVYAVPTIDGSQALVELDVPAGLSEKAFSTYTPVDLTRRQYITIARGLTGAHTVRLTNKNNAPSPGGNAMLIEAVAITAQLSDEGTEPPLWQANTAYVRGDVVRSSGYYYQCSTAGNSGSTPPSHTGGTQSYGDIAWFSCGLLSPYTIWSVDADYPSEREYAMNVYIGSVVDDIGGQTHGNEEVLLRTITIDGSPWSELSAPGVVAIGEEIVISETLKWSHSALSEFGDATLERLISAAETDIALNAEIYSDCTIGWMYPAMMPGVAYDGRWREEVWRYALSMSSQVDLREYVSAADPEVSMGQEIEMAYAGTIRGEAFAWIGSTTLESMGNFSRGASSALAFPNANASAGGGTSDWQTKLYFQRASGPDREAFSAGYQIAFRSKHRIGKG